MPKRSGYHFKTKASGYHVMKVGRLPLIPYYPPGDLDLARAVGVYLNQSSTRSMVRYASASRPRPAIELVLTIAASLRP